MAWQQDKGHTEMRNKINLKNTKKLWKIIKKILKPQQSFEGELRNVLTEIVKDISLRDNDEYRALKPNGVTTYSYGYGLSVESLE